MHRLLLIITSLLISLAGFAQTTPSDSLQDARKAQIEKARAEARAKAKARYEERAKMEAEKQKQATDSQKAEAKADEKAKDEKSNKREKRVREDNKNNIEAKVAPESKENEKKEEKPKKPSIKERNMADSTIAKSKYGPGTFGLRGHIGASVAWSDYSENKNKIGFDTWGFVLYGGLGYRLNHICYAGLSFDIEVIEFVSFSPMADIVVSAPTPLAPFVELTAGPYVSYNENRHWVFQPRVGLSYRGKKNKIMRFGFGMRMYDNTFNSDSFTPQYAASVTAEF